MTDFQHRVRSWLFVPADNEKMIGKALSSAADAVIFDLEDAVTPERKTAARDLVSQALEKDCRPARFVRVNGLATGQTGMDVAVTGANAPEGFVLPKCESPDDVSRLCDFFSARSQHKMPGVLAICTETVRGVRNLMRLDWRHPHLLGLSWGGEDLQTDIGGFANRAADGGYLSPYKAARDLTLLAAKDAGVLAIDAVYPDFRDIPGLVQETLEARNTGFDGKMAIHPSQLHPIHGAFEPREEELAWARRAIEAFATSPSGALQLDGSMLDRPHLKLAEKILWQASACE